MKRGGGRAKGNSFERKVAKEVVTAFSCFGVKAEDCYRTPLSGGHIHAKKEDPGDLVVSQKLRKYFQFHVECKAYRNVELEHLFTPIDQQKKAWKFKPWVEQANAAGRNGLHPMVVFKQNNGRVLALLPQLMPLAAKIKIRFKTYYHGEPWYLFEFSEILRQLVKQAKEHRGHSKASSEQR